MQGQRDIPLNDTGRGQASGNGKRLKAFLEQEMIDPAGLDFVSSPLHRTRSTMELLRQSMDLPVGDYRLEDQLKEITFGDWEGFTLEELAEEEQDLILQRRADKWGFVPPKGESYKMLAERIGRWLVTVDRLQSSCRMAVSSGFCAACWKGWTRFPFPSWMCRRTRSLSGVRALSRSFDCPLIGVRL